MSAILLIARVDLRRRWRELSLVAALVALASAAMMTAVVAADRSATSVDRYVEWSRLSSAGFSLDTDEPELLIETLLDAPQIEAVAVANTLSVYVGEDPDEPFSGTALNLTTPDPIGADATSAVSGVDVDRLLVIDGRLPDPGRAGEILVFEWLAQETGWAVGDRLTGQTLARADIEQLFGPDGSFPGFNGPTLELVVVGIGRSGPDIAGTIGDFVPSAYGSEQLVTTTRDEALWWGPGAAVLSATGASESDLVPVLEAAGFAPRDGATFGGEFTGGITDARAAALETATNTVEAMAAGFLVFAAGAAIAGVVFVGQAVVRHAAGAADAQRVLRELGLSRRDAAGAVTAPVLVATVVGVGIGSVVAVAASAQVPTGLARRAEVDPGVWVRPDLVLPIGAVVVALTTGFCFVVAMRSRSERPTSATGATGRFLAHLDPPPAVGTGVRLALDRGRGPRRLPTRSALGAMTIGVISAAAAVVVAHNVDELTATPARWGWNWSSSPDYIGDDPEGALEGLAADALVDGVAAFAANGVSVNGALMGGFALDPVSGEIGFTVREGRAPEAPGEVALGAHTLRRLDVSIGETVMLADFAGGNGRVVTVVGTAVFPYESAETIDDGAALLIDTLYDVTDESTASVTYVVRYAEGADRDVVEAALAEDHGLIFDRFTRPHPPAQVRNSSVAKRVAVTLALFFGLLAALAVTHAIAVSSRRRRLDLAVLRALGFVRRQVRVAFTTQSMVFGVVAAAVGVPVGVVVGRLVWRVVTDDLGAVTTPTMPWVTLASVVPIVLVVSVLLSWWPGRAASRDRPADALRAE